MKKRRNGKSLQRRHNAGTKKSGGGRFPTIFNKDMVPEGVEFWRCREGQHIVDIVPFEAGPNMPFDERLQPITEEGDLDYVLDLFVHTNVGNMKKPFVCPYENFGKPCPICEFIKGAGRLDKEDWKKLAVKHRVVYLLWVHDSREEEKKGIQVFEASHFFMEEKIEEIAKLPRGGGYENFSHPDKGKSLAWTRKGSGMENTQYLGHRFIEREAPLPNRILDMTFPLDSIINMHPEYEEIEREFRGTLKSMNLLESDDDDVNDDDAPFPDDIPDDDFDQPKKKKKKKRKRPTDRKEKSSDKSGKKPKRRRRKR
jgi:hypothetical protein